MKWVFVGCGGTFWAAANLLASLVKKHKPDMCYFVDPDVLEEKNLQRQWVNHAVGVAKVVAARKAVRVSNSRLHLGDFQSFIGKHEKDLIEGTVVFIVNVDNDAARLDVRDYCDRHPGWAIMVMSGCDVTYGQVYTGWWDKGRAHHDWAVSHPDVSRDTKKAVVEACGQTFVSNMLTASLLGPAIEAVCRDLKRTEPPEVMTEIYWRITEETGLRVWTDVLVPTGAVTVAV